MIEDIINELNLFPRDVEEISKIMHTNDNYREIFMNLSEEKYVKAYEELFRKCAYEYIKKKAEEEK